MYKVLIAEDMKWIRKGIATLIDNNQFEFTKIIEAADGQKAMDIIKKERPHIVITDIKMPNIDGIQLIKMTKELYPDIKFIIISGYAEKALNMGVRGYILKPIKDKELYDILNKVIAELKRQKEIKEIRSKQRVLKKNNNRLELENKINQILYGYNEQKENENLLNEIETYEISKDNNFVLALLNIDGSNYYQSDFKYEDLELLKFSIKNIIDELFADCKLIMMDNQKNRNQLILIFMNVNRNVVKISADRFLIEVYNKIIKYLKISITIGVSSVQNNISRDLYEQAKEALQLRLFNENNQIYKYDMIVMNQNYMIPKSKIKLLQKCIERYEIYNIKMILNDILTIDNLKDASVKHIRYIWLIISNILIKAFDLDVDKVLDLELYDEEFLNKFKSIDEIKNFIYTTIIDILNEQNVVNVNDNHIVEKARNYIEQNYDKNFTVKELALKLSINHCYFSTIFKKKMGQTVTQYITDIRIKNACKLLKETQVNITQIAESVGYQDLQYFYRVFKKRTGQTPLAYRNKNI